MLKLFENRFINFENKFINTMKKLAISVEEEGVIDVKPGRGGEVDAVAVEERRARHDLRGHAERRRSECPGGAKSTARPTRTCRATSSPPARE
jgi:hypothetical protein